MRFCLCVYILSDILYVCFGIIIRASKILTNYFLGHRQEIWCLKPSVMEPSSRCFSSINSRLLLVFICTVTSLTSASGSLHYYAKSDDVTANIGPIGEAGAFDIYEFYREFRAKKDEERRIREDFLALLGLSHPPHPQQGVVTSSAPRFLLELYRHLELSDLGEGYSEYDVTGDRMTSALLGNEAVTSDMIIAFVNDRGRNIAYMHVYFW